MIVETITISNSNLVTKQDLNQAISDFRQDMVLGFANLENKILRMTIILGATFVVGLGMLVYQIKLM